MTDQELSYPHSCEIPGTRYYLEVIDASEFRMGAPYCHLRILDSDRNVVIDLSDWACYSGYRASDCLNQSKENPHILILPFLVHESYRKGEIEASKIRTLKFNVIEMTYRVSERHEANEDVTQKFYPLSELPKMKAFLETHIHSRKARRERSRFY